MVHIWRWIPAPKRFAAITLPPLGILFRKSWWTSATPKERDALIKHERVHWDQYQRYGLLGFYARYVYYALRFGYRDNPMEKEARNGTL